MKHRAVAARAELRIVNARFVESAATQHVDRQLHEIDVRAQTGLGAEPVPAAG